MAGKTGRFVIGRFFHQKRVQEQLQKADLWKRCVEKQKKWCVVQRKKDAKKGAKSAIYQKIQTWGARVAREKGREGLKKQIFGAKWIPLREIGSQKTRREGFQGRWMRGF